MTPPAGRRKSRGKPWQPDSSPGAGAAQHLVSRQSGINRAAVWGRLLTQRRGDAEVGILGALSVIPAQAGIQCRNDAEFDDNALWLDSADDVFGMHPALDAECCAALIAPRAGIIRRSGSSGRGTPPTMVKPAAGVISIQSRRNHAGSARRAGASGGSPLMAASSSGSHCDTACQTLATLTSSSS